MQITLKPSALSGSVVAPASKSVMQRACAAALLREGLTVINNYGSSADDRAVLQIVRQLGGLVFRKDSSRMEIVSPGLRWLEKPEAPIDCGESGLAVRMFLPLLALLNAEVTVIGQGSLLQRPLDFFDEVLPKLGVAISSRSGFLPIRIHGPLRPRNLTIDGSLSSQFLTGLLMAYSARGAQQKRIECLGLKSKPYVDLTLSVMESFGMPLPRHDGERFYYFDGPYATPDKGPIEYTVEGDWSNAAFWLVAGALHGDVSVQGLDMGSAQADRTILEALEKAGAHITMSGNVIRARKSLLSAFEFDATDCPDLFPPLAVLAAYARGVSRIKGVHRLLHKESDRSVSLGTELEKMGVGIEVHDDVMHIEAPQVLRAARLDSHNDHRIAMAGAIAAMGASGPVTIHQAGAVEKSYPDFFRHLKNLMHH